MKNNKNDTLTEDSPEISEMLRNRFLREQRIRHYEPLLEKAEAALREEDAVLDNPELEGWIEELTYYYESEDWKSDFAADENGLLPADLKRGVLSEDGIYNVLERYKEIRG